MNSVTRSVTVMCSGLYKQNNSPSSSANRHIAPILKTAINFLHRRLRKCTFTLELNGFIKAPYRCENKFRVRIPVYIRQRIAAQKYRRKGYAKSHSVNPMFAHCLDSSAISLPFVGIQRFQNRPVPWTPDLNLALALSFAICLRGLKTSWVQYLKTEDYFIEKKRKEEKNLVKPSQ